MQMIVIVKINGTLFEETKDKLRRKIIKEMKEGLVVIDDNIEITTISVPYPFAGLLFNINEEEENEKNDVA